VTGASIRLVRHASTDWTGVRWAGRTDLPLNEAGRGEAEALAVRLAADLREPAFVASPALRAQETAAILAVPFGASVATEPELREADLGQVDGLTFEEVAAAFPGVAEAVLAGRMDVDWPGGERAGALEARAVRAWHRLTGMAGHADLVAVTHGGVIAALLRVALPDARNRPPWAGPATVVHLVGGDGADRTDGAWRIVA
jgi:probable phosphoglycerate mutase